MLASPLEKKSTIAMQTSLLFPTKIEFALHPVYKWNPGRDVHFFEPRFDAFFCIEIWRTFFPVPNKIQFHPILTSQSGSRYQLNQLGSKAASESTFDLKLWSTVECLQGIKINNRLSDLDTLVNQVKSMHNDPRIRQSPVRNIWTNLGNNKYTALTQEPIQVLLV